jgi:hypothetical protein
LKEGKRDEHGMEEIEGMFSSPEKSPTRLNGFANNNGSIINSDGMSIDDGKSSNTVVVPLVSSRLPGSRIISRAGG